MSAFAAAPVACADYYQDPRRTMSASMTRVRRLKYDFIDNQDVGNWATPKATGCHKVTVTPNNGRPFFAFFYVEYVVSCIAFSFSPEDRA